MRGIFTIVLVLAFMGSFAQNESDLLIFNANGSSFLQRGDQKILKIDGEELKNNDILYVVNGAVTIISRTNKRITLDENGKFSYNDVSALMNKAEASLSTRYFVNVWDQMNDKHENVNYRGGVVRGNAVPSFPIDSALILSDSICFEYFIDGEKPTGISIKNEHFRELFYLNLDTNIVVLPLFEINNAKPGVYYYEFDGNPMQCFIIPDADEREDKLAVFKDIEKTFSDFDASTKLMLIHDYMIENKVYVFGY